MQALQLEVARMGERMNTQQANYEGALERLGKQIAERDTANTRWIVGTVAVASVLIMAVLGLLIRWPG